MRHPPLSGAGTTQPLGKTVSTNSPLCQEAADSGAAQARSPTALPLGAAMAAILPWQSLLEGTPLSLSALE